jgi:sulfate transport system ATP-binding protein
VRKSLRKELRRIHDATGVTTIFVTHDQEEALELADRVAILNKGVIEQVGTPEDVHDRPATAFVCGFVGEANRFEGRVEKGAFRAGEVVLDAKGQAEGPAQAFVRPHQFDLAPAGQGFEVLVERIQVQGPAGRLDGRTRDGQKIEYAFGREQLGRIGEAKAVRLAARGVFFFGAGAISRS